VTGLSSKLNRCIRFAHAAENNAETIDAHGRDLVAEVLLGRRDMSWMQYFADLILAPGSIRDSISGRPGGIS
jgi:hypothetical protein